MATWLSSHCRALEGFGAVPARLIIDNPKYAVTRASSRDRLVQRAYAGWTEGYGFKIDPCPPAGGQGALLKPLPPIAPDLGSWTMVVIYRRNEASWSA